MSSARSRRARWPDPYNPPLTPRQRARVDALLAREHPPEEAEEYAKWHRDLTVLMDSYDHCSPITRVGYRQKA